LHYSMRQLYPYPTNLVSYYLAKKAPSFTLFIGLIS
jgi:hypothetical protein